MRRFRPLAWGSLLALALTVRFAFDTALVNRAVAALAVSATVLPAALALLAVTIGVKPNRPLEGRDRQLALALGLAVWLVPLLVASVRRTDAPSGTEMLFFTTAVWGLLLVVGSILAARRFSVPTVAVAALGVTGVAGVLANWERPSSFSPFVKFPTQELVILAAGVVWVVAVVVLEGLVRRHGPLATLRVVAPVAAVSAFVGVLVLAPGQLAALRTPDLWAAALPSAAATFAIVLSLAEGLADRPTAVFAAAYLLPVPILSALSFVEQATGLRGATPIIWTRAFPGIVVAVVAAAVLAASADRPSPERLRSRLLRAARIVAALTLLIAAISLVTPAVFVSVKGTEDEIGAFAVRFAMLGFETAGGWLAACCALLVGGWAFSRRWSTTEALMWTVALLVAIAAWLPLHTTTLHTWTTWIPAEVQQDYGTEYASRTEEPVTNVAEIATLAGAAACAALLWAGGRREAAVGQEGA